LRSKFERDGSRALTAAEWGLLRASRFLLSNRLPILLADLSAPRRRFFYFYIASLLQIALDRATQRPALWDDIADTWLALVPGARALRKTFYKMSLWSADEAACFAEIKTEDEGEEYWLGFIAPDAIRYH
jgi:hypothetical protein